ncbi:MAG: S1 RNA-binding domain-containing protein [Acutalibacteraceae bacterium]|jgi:S1 RNA binding domain protein
MQVEVGVIVEGKITGLTKFGAFVELPGGGTGMVHISEVASTYVKEITDFLSEGQVVKVKVIGVNEEGKISLSIKKAQEPTERPQRSKSSYSHNSGGGRGRQSSNQNVWQGQKTQNNKNMSFEDMMQKFKQVSDEKMTDLKHFNESKHGGGFSRRGGNNRHK